MKIEVIIRMHTYTELKSGQTLDQYNVIGKLEVKDNDELKDLKEFIQPGIMTYEDEHPRI